MSPRRKKIKPDKTSNTNPNKFKRENETEDVICKRTKSDVNKDEELQIKKRKNFVTACEQVSRQAYFDHRSRLLLVYLPSCMKEGLCRHHELKNIKNINEMPSYAEESFKIEAKTNMWYEALEVCLFCIKPTQYLSGNVLKEVVEIMLNAHEDDYGEHTISTIIDKCQQILSANFNMHPPCFTKSLRKCYNDFLTSPMDLKENTFTNRSEFGCDKGIVKYCMNRLEYEISADSKDEALVNKYENIPEEMRQSVQGMHWQKEKFEIFELLERTERIQRLMAVLESIIELLQFDLAVWHSRYTNNLGSHIMRSHKPLMAYILWSNNVLYTGAVNNNCRQILRLFVHMVYLQYPKEYIKIMTRNKKYLKEIQAGLTIIRAVANSNNRRGRVKPSVLKMCVTSNFVLWIICLSELEQSGSALTLVSTWLNTMIQTFYICETNSNSDYPNTGKYCTSFANEFYKIISGMPNECVLRIVESIQPSFMQNLIGTLHLRTLLSTDCDCIMKILIDFIKEEQWKTFPESNDKILIAKKLFSAPKKIKKKLNYLSKKCIICVPPTTRELESPFYPKLDPEPMNSDSEMSLNFVVHTIYITLEAYLDAYSVQSVQETWNVMNEQLLNDESELKINSFAPDLSCYSVTEQFIKKYRYIYQTLREVILLFQELKNSNELPEFLKFFENIGLLEI